MRTLLVAAGLGLLLVFPMAMAQSLAGISLGDKEAKVLKALPGAPGLSIDDNPKHRLIYQDGKTIWLCSGVVYIVQQTMGSTLTDYISLVERETAKRGKPTVASGITGTGSNSVGWMDSGWTERGARFEVQMEHTTNGHRVLFSLIGKSQC